MEHLLANEVDPPTEEPLKVDSEPRSGQDVRRLEVLHQQIDIGIRPGLPSSQRSEDSERADPVPSPKACDLPTVGTQNLCDP